MADAIVIGAGISGLAAAWRLHELGRDVRVFERSTSSGGAMRTVQREGWRHEWGPNSFLGSHEALHALANEVGVTPVAASAAASRRYLFLDGRLQSMPANPLDAITTNVLPASAKLRLLAEPLQKKGVRDDETVREFFEHRLGKEFTDRFIDAFVSGIYAGDIAKLGVAAAFPKLFRMVREHGSLVKGAFAGRKGGGKPAKRGTYSFHGGLGDLPQAIARKLGDRLKLGAEVSVARDGNKWVVDGVRAPELIVSAPAFAAGKLLEGLAPELSRELAAMPYAPIAGVHLLYRDSSIRIPFDGFGFLIPRREKVRMLGCIWSSAMFEVAPAGHRAMTIFIGGAHDPAALELSDEALVAEVRRDLKTTMGIDDAPVDVSVVKHARAIPQYGPSHVAWRSRVHALSAAIPGLSLTGNYLEGISMSETVAQADRTARAAAARGAEAKAA